MVLSPGTFREPLAAFLTREGLGFGTLDILCLGAAQTADRILTLCDLLLHATDQDDCLPFQQLLLVVPPTVTEELGGQGALQLTLERLLPESLPAACVQAVETSDLGFEAVIALVADAKPGSVVIVADAASLRTEDIPPFCLPGTAAPTLEEDFWAPQLHGLAHRLKAAVAARKMYVLLDAGQSSPHRTTLVVLLTSIDAVGVLGSEFPNDPEALLATKHDEWLALAAQGLLGAVWKDIDATPVFTDLERRLLRIQVLSLSRLHGLALAAIEELPDNAPLSPAAWAKLARVAADAGSRQLASRFLFKAAPKLNRREVLEFALQTAHAVGEAHLEATIAARLEHLFPGASRRQLVFYHTTSRGCIRRWPVRSGAADRYLRFDRAGYKAILLRELVKVRDGGCGNLLLCIECDTRLEDHFAYTTAPLG